MTDNSEGKPSRYFRIISGLYELTSLWSTDLSTVLTDFFSRPTRAFPKREIIVSFPVPAEDFHKTTNFRFLMRLCTIHTFFMTYTISLKGFTHFGFVQKWMINHFQPSM